MSRYHTTQDGNIAFTDEENAQRDAEEKAWADGAATRAALAEIHRLEAEVTPRRMRDHALGTGGDWLKDKEAEIATERGKL